MNKMQKLQSVNDQIRTLRDDNNVLAELCARIEGYVKEEKFLPADLYDSAIMQLNSMKEAQALCRKGLCGYRWDRQPSRNLFRGGREDGETA